MASTVRSLLFVPGHQGTRFDKARQSGADSIVLDLEDAVPVDLKDEARAQVAQWLAGRAKGVASPQIAVRVNAADTPWYADDLAMCASAGVDALMLPKSEDPAVLHAVAARLPTIALLPLVETARGMARLEEIAAAPGVQRLVFGTIDFQADLDIEGEGLELLYFRSRMVLASRVAGIQSPVDGVSTSIDDAARIEADALQARRLGFGAKLCIHPKQVAVVNQGLSPTQAQIDWARRVIEADAASGAAPVAVDGKMVDRPVVLKAQSILRAAERR
ncbi:MAG: CoA ester lyase [Variovorax sp.]|nr:CoA ester lyase [Variovorax sp.]